MRNKTPIKNAGTSIISEPKKDMYQGSTSTLATENIIWIIPAIMKVIPPTISCFHDIHRTIANIKEGKLCIKRPTNICKLVSPGSKTSNENIVKKRIKNIDNILGIQYRVLLIFLLIFVIKAFN